MEWIAKTVDETKKEIAVQGDDIQKGYQIQWGDTLWGISQATGIPISQIVAANNLADPDLIYAGDFLYMVSSETHATLARESSKADVSNDAPVKVTQSYKNPTIKTSVATYQKAELPKPSNTPAKIPQQTNTQTEKTNVDARNSKKPQQKRQLHNTLPKQKTLQQKRNQQLQS